MESLLYDNDIIRYIKSKVNSQDWEDILQNSIIEYIKIKNKDKIINPKNYYFKIVKNQIYKYYVKKEMLRSHEKSTNDYDISVNLEYDLLKDYELLYEIYVKGSSINELCEKYRIKKSCLYERIKKEKEELRHDLFL